MLVLILLKSSEYNSGVILVGTIIDKYGIIRARIIA